LNHAHERGIVHRDIKPSNLLLIQQDESRLMKLTDFGLALDLKDEEEARLTKAGTTLGTVDYMSPEQARGQLTDSRSDIYSLGCTAYFMLTGFSPFPDGTIPEKLYKHCNAYPTDPRELNSTIPDEIINLLGKMLQKKPEDRYQSMLELLDDVKKLQEYFQVRPSNLLAPLPDGDTELPPALRVPAFQSLHNDESEEELTSVEGDGLNNTLILIGLGAALVMLVLAALLYVLS
jgi:serine/threonine-protein kinase